MENYFLNYNCWLNGIKILEQQLKDKAEGKKYCRTLQLEKLERLEKNCLTVIKSKKFYERFVSNSLFYGIEKYFYLYDYPKPKTYLEIRTFTIFSFAMLSIHNMIAFYLLSITNEYVDGVKKSDKKINSYYGGNLKIDKNNLNINTYDLYYFNYYKKFKEKIKLKCEKKERRMILKIDLKNYYSCISVEKLLNKIQEKTYPTKETEHNYTKENIDKIIKFYKYISIESKDDIPVYDNGISSDFMGYLYLFFIEREIFKELTEKYLEIEFELIRYVDDIFIVIDFKNEIKIAEMMEKALKILSNISNTLYSKYKLHLNAKTKIYDCSNEEEIEQLKEDLSLLSNEEIEPENEIKNPQDSLDEIFSELEKIKQQGIASLAVLGAKKDLGNIDLEILKDIYAQQVLGILNKVSEKQKFKKILEKFPIKLFKLAPKPLLVILTTIGYTEKISEIKEYLIKEEELNITDLNLILEILGQEGYKDSDLIKKLSENNYFKKIIESMENEVEDKIIYLNVDITNMKISDILEKTEELIFQIIQRKFSEKEKNYSLALNHLVNEMQLLVYKLINKQKIDYSKYTVESIKQDLKTLELHYDIIHDVGKIFDLRNLNQISHSVSDKRYSKIIDDKQYFIMLKTYENLLKELNEKI